MALHIAQGLQMTAGRTLLRNPLSDFAQMFPWKQSAKEKLIFFSNELFKVGKWHHRTLPTKL